MMRGRSGSTHSPMPSSVGYSLTPEQASLLEVQFAVRAAEDGLHR